MKTEKIHRGNYEEYFLLYVDNELSEQDKKLVDDFIEANIDLKAEFDILFDTKLTHEDISFAGKDGLLKNEIDKIEELHLLLLDDELTPDQQIRLNSIHTSHPEVLADLERLKQTKLPEEKIAHPNKHKLYKRSTAVIILRWLAPAAAAAVLIIIFLLKNTNKADQQSLPEMIVAENNVDVTKDEAPRITEKETVKKDEVMNDKKSISNIPVHTNTNPNPVSDEQDEQPITESIVSREPENITEQTPEIAVTEKNISETSTTIKTDYVQEGILETNTYEEEPEQSRKSFRGFVRKASRFYNKVTNLEVDRPVIRLTRNEKVKK